MLSLVVSSFLSLSLSVADFASDSIPRPLLAPDGAALPELGLQSEANASGWSRWWQLNRDPLLELKENVWRTARTEAEGDGPAAELRPSAGLIYERVVPELLAILEGERDDALLGSALIALGRVGVAPETRGFARGASIEEALREYVSHPNHRVAEQAVLALGILGSERSVFFLSDLLEDTTAGRRTAGGGSLGERQRAFAAYALGLCGARAEREEVRRFVVHKLAGTLEDWKHGTRDLPVACVQAIGIVPLGSCGNREQITEVEDGPAHSRESQIAYLSKVFRDRSRPFLVRAHVPTALARLARSLPESSDSRRGVAALCLEPISPHSKAQREIQQSCVLALGLLADSDGDAADREVRRELMRVTDSIGDPSVRHFALISLGRIGGRPGHGSGEPLSATGEIAALLRTQLLEGRTSARPWAGLALGILNHDLAKVHATRSAPENDLALKMALVGARSTRDIGALGLSAGLAGSDGGAERMLAVLDGGGEPVTRGYAALGLGFLARHETLASLEGALGEGTFLPALLEPTAIAFALMGDKGVVELLLEGLDEAESFASQASLARALAQVGDARAVEPMIAMLGRRDLTDRARAKLVDALGAIGEKDALPWSSMYSVDSNYLAAPPSFSGQMGVLDMR